MPDLDTPASLEAEARAALATAPADPSAPAGSPVATGTLPVDPAQPSPEEVLEGYRLIAVEVVDVGASALVPAWRVSPEKSNKLGTAMAKAAMLWWPDMIIPPKYLALITIAGVVFEIAQDNKDPATGRYRPARLAEPVRAEAAQPAAAPAQH